MGMVYPHFIIVITLHGSRPVTSHTYTRLTMASYEHSKLTHALGNTHQKIHPRSPPTSLTLIRKHL